MRKDNFEERTCPICKKKMVRLTFSEYVYRVGTKYFCGWTCYRKAQKQIKEKEKAK